MYNTDDIVNDVSTKDCFHSLLDMALELQEKNNEKAEEYFNIIRGCLGIDFSIIYDADADTLLNIDCYHDTEVCFEVSPSKNTRKDMHEEIDRIFDLVGTVITDGIFSQSYYNYLKSRERVLENLIHYYNLYTNMLPVNDFLLFNRVTKNSDLKEKGQNEIKDMIGILSNNKKRNKKKN